MNINFKIFTYLDLIFPYEKINLITEVDNYSNIIFVYSEYWKENLIKLQLLCEQKKVPFMIKVNNNKIDISFDEKILNDPTLHYNPIKNRILALDLNPNYIAYTIIDYKNEDNKNSRC